MHNPVKITPVKQTLKKALAGLAISLFATTASAADLWVTVSSIEQASGEIMLAIYDSENNFQKTVKQASRRNAEVGELKFQFPDLAPGEYAVMVFHDINGNGKLDTNLLGLPTEPWGASLQDKTIFGAPGWKDVKFDLTNEANITIKLN